MSFSKKKYGTIDQPSLTEPNRTRKIPNFMKIPNKLFREAIDKYDEDIVVRDLAYDLFLQNKRYQKGMKHIFFGSGFEEEKSKIRRHEIFTMLNRATSDDRVTMQDFLDPKRSLSVIKDKGAITVKK